MKLICRYRCRYSHRTFDIRNGYHEMGVIGYWCLLQLALVLINYNFYSEHIKKDEKIASCTNLFLKIVTLLWKIRYNYYVLKITQLYCFKRTDYAKYLQLHVLHLFNILKNISNHRRILQIIACECKMIEANLPFTILDNGNSLIR